MELVTCIVYIIRRAVRSMQYVIIRALTACIFFCFPLIIKLTIYTLMKVEKLNSNC